MPMPGDMGGYTPQQSGSGPSLTAFNPTWRDRMAQMLMGDAKPSPEKARLVEGLMGSRGLGSTGMGLADVTPAGIPLQAQEAYRAGDDRMLAMALMPGPKKPGGVRAPEIRTAYNVNGKIYDLPGSATHTEVLANATDAMGFNSAADLNKWFASMNGQAGYTVGGKFIGKADAANRLGMAPYELDSQSQNLERLLELFPGPKKPGIKGFHGSPHDFAAERLVQWPDGRKEYLVGAPDRLPDVPSGASVVQDFPLGRFREDKVGTGEGAQAYGYGVAYIAENEGVARQYRDNLSNPNSVPDTLAKQLLDAHGGHAQALEVLTAMRGEPYIKNVYPETTLEGAEAILRKGGSPVERAPGRMYEVEINADPDDFLDWDKPLSQQPEKVREALATVPDYQEAIALLPSSLRDKPRSVYNQLSELRQIRIDPVNKSKSGAPDVSDYLGKQGIPGIKYLDQGSRTAGEGSRNYVPFRDDIVDIVKKYGVAFATTLYGAEAVKQATAE